MKIALTVGHSILKNGNITSADGTKFGGVSEYKYNKALAPYVAKYLRELGHTVDVIICPEKQFTVSTEEKAYKLNIVNDGTYELVVELHLNASEKSNAKGVEAMYKSPAGKVYADRVQTKLSTLFNNRGVLYKDNLYMLNATKPVAIMLETFFCTNKDECKIGNNQDLIGKLIAEGIANKAVSNKPKVPNTPITVKSSVEDIKWMQTQLNKVNKNYQVTVNGLFDQRTRLSLLQFAVDVKGWDWSKTWGYTAKESTIKSLARFPQ